MKRKLLPVFLLCATFSFAQERTTASGGEVTGASGSVSYSIGLIDYTAVSGASGSITQGVQQPYEIFSVGIEEWDMSIDISVFPNPATDVLQITSGSTDELAYSLYDAQGRLIQNGIVQNGTTTIDLSQLAVASYQLAILKNDGFVRSYKVLKN